MPRAFCETNTAGPETPWHIRNLTETGMHLSGGADTLALCGRKVAWDVMPYEPDSAAPVCARCNERIREQDPA